MTTEPTAPPEITAADVALIRAQLGLDQPQFGQLIGMGERTVRGWENGATIPAGARFMLQLLRHVMHVSAEPCQDVPGIAFKYPALGAGSWLPADEPWARTWLRDLDALLRREPGQ